MELTRKEHNLLFEQIGWASFPVKVLELARGAPTLEMRQDLSARGVMHFLQE